MVDRWLEKYRWALCALSGVLLVLSFAPFSCATCGWIALVPAWWVITRSDTAQRQPIRHGYLIGLIYFAGTFWWICNVTAIGTFFLVLYLALYPAVWFLFSARLILPPPGQAKMPVLFQATGGAALWVLLEWWRSWFLTGFNWNELGISQSTSIVFRQLAAYGGVHLISFVLVAVNILWAEGLLAMAQTLQEKRIVRPSFPFAAALVLVAAIFALGWHHLQRHRGETLQSSISYACVQPNIPQIPYDGGPWINFQHRENEALQALVKISQQALVAKPELLIWPEATIDQGVFNDRPLNEAVHAICENYDGNFLLGSQDSETESHQLFNCAYLFTPYGDRYDIYKKTRLVILGEYLPFGDTFPWLRRAVGMGLDFSPGPGPKKFGTFAPVSFFAPLICFEDTLSDVADKAARLNPQFFITITNDGWYRGWYAEWGIRQHLQHAVFRCVEHDRPMIRCANNGISCEIDQNGTVTDRFRDAAGHDIDTGGVFTHRLAFYPAHPTIHEAWGDWIILISSLVSGMLVVQLFYRLGHSLLT